MPYAMQAPASVGQQRPGWHHYWHHEDVFLSAAVSPRWSFYRGASPPNQFLSRFRLKVPQKHPSTGLGVRRPLVRHLVVRPSSREVLVKILILHLSDIHISSPDDPILTRGNRIVEAVRNLDYALD